MPRGKLEMGIKPRAADEVDTDDSVNPGYPLWENDFDLFFNEDRATNISCNITNKCLFGKFQKQSVNKTNKDKRMKWFKHTQSKVLNQTYHCNSVYKFKFFKKCKNIICNIYFHSTYIKKIKVI